MHVHPQRPTARARCRKLLEFDVLPLEWPCCLGCDASGTIAAAPPGSPWTVGDRVWAYTNIGKPYSGSFAEYVRVPGDVVGSVPDGVGMGSRKYGRHYHHSPRSVPPHETNPGIRYVCEAIRGPAIAMCDEVPHKGCGREPMLATVDPMAQPGVKATLLGMHAGKSYDVMREDPVQYVPAVSDLVALRKLAPTLVQLREGLKALTEGLDVLKDRQVSINKVAVIL